MRSNAANLLALLLLGPTSSRADSPLLSKSQRIIPRLDASRYRSSSQGPLMPEELRPLEPDFYHEIDEVIERATRTDGWGPIIPMFSGRRDWAWRMWQGRAGRQIARQAEDSTIYLEHMRNE